MKLLKNETKLLLSRLGIIVLGILLQISYLIVIVWKVVEYYVVFAGISSILGICLVLWIGNKRINPSYKLAWTTLILLVPIFGVIFYLLCGRSDLSSHLRKKCERANRKFSNYLVQDLEVWKDLKNRSSTLAKQAHYLNRYAGFPVYGNTNTKYYAKTEEAVMELKNQLKAAKKFIFMEYFIIADDPTWNEILNILIEKVKEGVEVRFLYDDMGSVTRVPYHYEKKLASYGIRCHNFNPLMPIVAIVMNHRDHRKITVIDGKVGFTGGFNLADEYVNRIQKYGLWKDASVKIEGDAVDSLTAMFLEMWHTIEYSNETCEQYFHCNCKKKEKVGGFVQPYCDTPLDHECVGENVYMNMINNAKEYVYCYTPYLIIDNEMMEAFCLAAKSGVDVRIVTPHIPDKKIVFKLTRSYYPQLIDAGVKIYEYTPGFLHSKCFLSDDRIAACGTINLDYRSLYLHFECGCLLYETDAVLQMKEDMLKTFALGTEITKEFCNNTKWITRLIQSILRLFAPLM